MKKPVSLTISSFNESAKQSISSSPKDTYWRVNVVSVYIKYSFYMIKNEVH